MADHSATIDVEAPVEQVYQLFTHFNDYPKFMTYIKEVTYQDDTHSHWVADVLGHHEWDAVNDNWVENQKISWHSTAGAENSGQVLFESLAPDKTHVTVDISYDPPAGFLGDVGEALGAGKKFEHSLQHDLEHFASMVQQAPPGALDPTSSNYLFHSDSAAAKGQTTPDQDATMTGDNRIANETESASNASALI